MMQFTTTPSSESTLSCFPPIHSDRSVTDPDSAEDVINFIDHESYHRYCSQLLRIELFVDKILSCSELGFTRITDQQGRPNLSIGPLAFYFFIIPDYYCAFRPDYAYSVKVDLFFTCCQTLALENESFFNPHASTQRSHSGQSPQYQFELFNDLVTLIRAQANTSGFRKAVQRQAEKSIQNFHSASDYIDALFQHSDKRLLVLRVDFSYRRDYVITTTPEIIKSDLDHFLSNRRGNPKLFSDWAGYIGKIEWGADKGLHIHLALFFKGSRRWKDVYLAQAIGEYWTRITMGRGIYWNCNANKDDYQMLGIGMIHQNDTGKRKILLNSVIRYMTKSDQSLIAKKHGKGQCFIRGNMPK